MATDLSLQVTFVMFREMADLGPMIVKKKCKDVGLDYENITAENLPLVSKVISEAMANFGPDVSKRIYNEISRLRNMERMVDGEANAGKRLDGYITLGDAARLSGEHAKAMGFYAKVLASKDSPEAKRHAPRAECMTGLCLNLMNDPKKAMEHFTRALEPGEEGMDDGLRALVHRGIGYSSWRQGDFGEAQRQYDEALEWAAKSGDKDLVGTLKIDIGMLLENTGRYDESLASYKEAIGILDGSKNYYNLARAHNNSGEIYKHYEQFIKAIECYDCCHEISKTGRNEVMMGYALGNSAECYAKMGELNKARENAAKTMAIFEKRKDLYMIAGVHLIYGIIHSKEGDKARTDKHFSEAIRQLRAINYPYEVGTYMFEYAKALKALGCRSEAKERFREALEIFRKLGSEKFAKAVEDELKAL